MWFLTSTSVFIRTVHLQVGNCLFINKCPFSWTEAGDLVTVLILIKAKKQREKGNGNEEVTLRKLSFNNFIQLYNRIQIHFYTVHSYTL